MTRRVVLVGMASAVFAMTVGIGASPIMNDSSNAAAATSGEPRCIGQPYACADLYRHTDYEGNYSGHDEPSLLFYSSNPGSGNRSEYTLKLPHESAVLPSQDGTGGTWNFQLHPTFWFGMALCDNQSGPEYTHAPCTPDSDTNIFNSPDPSAPDWIGHHPGSALLEVQFYPPGWAPFADSCTATQWCAAMTIDSVNFSDLTGIDNNANCLKKVGDEPVNYAFVTKNGQADGAAGPLESSTVAFNPSTDFTMNAGDRIGVDIHDTAAGVAVILNDQTSGRSGSMTASTGNGFAQVLYEPTAKKCHEAPYAFHPMYSTSTPNTRVEWAAHSSNVSFSDEIGHFEYCNNVKGNGNCKQGNATDPTHDADDNFCIPASQSLLVQISGCISVNDNDFDAASYQPVWPGAGGDPAKTSQPVRVTSPTFGHHQQFSQTAFEANLVVLERIFGYCSTANLSACTVPPPGVAFYPMYTTGQTATHQCEWREGGPNIPGATDTFGGSPATEWGAPVASFYPTGPASTGIFYENFQRVLPNNPCPA